MDTAFVVSINYIQKQKKSCKQNNIQHIFTFVKRQTDENEKVVIDSNVDGMRDWQNSRTVRRALYPLLENAQFL